MAKFKKGESGNSAGRPAGRTPAGQLRKAIVDAAPSLIESLIAQALQGDTMANKVLLDKIVPNLKAQSLPITIQSGKSLAESGQHVLNATLSGDVSPDVSALILSAIANQSRIEEFTLLEQRIAALEGTGNA
jgi:hypothetical protein